MGHFVTSEQAWLGKSMAKKTVEGCTSDKRCKHGSCRDFDILRREDLSIFKPRVLRRF